MGGKLMRQQAARARRRREQLLFHCIVIEHSFYLLALHCTIYSYNCPHEFGIHEEWSRPQPLLATWSAG